MNSWHARTAVLTFMQVMVFCNLFLLQQVNVINEIRGLVLHLICDEQLEVSAFLSDINLSFKVSFLCTLHNHNHLLNFMLVSDTTNTPTILGLQN